MSKYQILQPEGVFNRETRTIVLPNRSSPDWLAYQDWLTAGNSPLPPSSVGQDDLATTKLKRQLEIDSYAAGLRNRAVRGRSAAEMATWSAKLVEAKAFTATSDPLQAPLLASTATVRGITLAALVAKVNAQAAPFLQVEAYIDGTRGKHNDAIEAMLDVPSIVTYNWMAGWPNIP